MKKFGKKYQAALAKIDQEKVYELEEAAALVKATSTTKFDSTVGVSFTLNVNPTLADQLIRGTISLPNGTGKTKVVLALTRGKQQEAKDAGADFVGDVDLIEKIQKENWFAYDVIVCTPDMMGELGKMGRLLGPKGLMPNPKLGTVTADVATAVKNAKAGEVQYRVEKNGIVHAGVAKASFSADQIYDNAKLFIDTIMKAKPASLKGTYLKKISISSTMGVGVRVDSNNL